MPSAITATGLSKRYRIGGRIGRVGGRLRRRAGEEIWALKDVSFEVGRGEVLGVIGRNGAGKSTLLKVLARITEPTAGRAVLSGRLGSLLEVGTGFHGELTGRENVYLSGAILGMRKAEIDARFDEVVEFSGVERFLDTPIKRYSSGMKVRLGFAVAAHLEPEILLVDEVLAVGDAAFQQRCLGKMESLEQGGRTVIFVSHNMPSVRRLCTCCIWLEGGRVAAAGQAGPIVDAYMSAGVPVGEAGQAGLAFEVAQPEPLPEAWLTRLELLDAEGRPAQSVRTGDPLRARIGFRCAQAGRYSIFFSLQTRDGCQLLGCAMEGTDAMQVSCAEGAHEVDFCLPQLPLTAGGYYVGAAISRPRQRFVHREERIGRLDVAPADVFGSGRPPTLRDGALAVPHRWEVSPSAGIQVVRLT
jgi:lipopolysaccharide transport system ATP-binding protein